MKRLIFILATLLFSCNGFLDRHPQSDIYVGSFWKSASDAQAGITAMYSSWSQAMATGYFDWGELRGGNWDAYDRFGLAQAELINHAIPSTNSACLWSVLYQTINRANLALKHIPSISMPPATKNTLLGEAHTMRALCYFYAVRVWGDVPLFEEPVERFDSEQAYVARTAKESALALVEADLAEAERLLPAMTATTSKIRFSRATVYAAMMDVYAWQHRYDLVIEVFERKLQPITFVGLDATITSALNQTDFTARWRGIFDEENPSREIITAIDYAYLENGANKAIEYFASGSQHVIASENLKMSYASGDKRYQGSFDTSNARHPLTRFWKAGTILSGTGAVYSDVNLPVYTYSDVVLLYAEGLAREFRTADAVAQLNRIRTRAGVVAAVAGDYVSQEELLLDILHERRVELLGLGCYWFDLVRTGNAATLGGCNDSRKFVFPIHRDHLLQNKKLIQNDGWN